VLIGLANTSILIADADTFWAAQALICGAASNVVIGLVDADSTGTTAWTAGTAQVETATVTAASGCTADGTMTLVVTASGLTGSPLNVPVALTTALNTAALVAGAARTALAANAAVAALFTVGGSSATITLTRKPLATYTVGAASVPTYPANDGTLNLAIPSGLGVTAAATSTNTTAGVLSSGCYLADADVKDFEGITLTPIASNRLGGVVVKNNAESTGGISATSLEFTASTMPVDSSFQFSAKNCDGNYTSLTITPSGVGTRCLVTIVACGATA